jgi:hypothetical protein
MELKLDIETFEAHQEAFIEEIIRSIAAKLVEGGLEGLKMENLTAEIAFSIASILDDTTHIESDDAEVKPYLTFRASDDEIIHCGENAYTYEFVTPILNRLFPPKG